MNKTWWTFQHLTGAGGSSWGGKRIQKQLKDSLGTKGHDVHRIWEHLGSFLGGVPVPRADAAHRRVLSLTDIKRLAPCTATIDLQVLLLLDFINKIHKGDGDKRDRFYDGLRQLQRVMESRFQDFVERPVLEMYDTCWAGRDLADPTTELLQLLRHMQITNITGGTFFSAAYAFG